jgi:GNAT superfamily N-acetyltransferase
MGLRCRERGSSTLGPAISAPDGWDWTFESLVAEIVARFVRKYDAARERCWIAEREGERVGCVFLVRKTDEVGQLRCLLVDPSARGLGIGRRLVRECVRHARDVGYRRMMLWTAEVLEGARRISESSMASILSHHSLPHSPAYDAMVRWMCAVVGGSGADLEAGQRLRRTFLGVGLPEPVLHLEVTAPPSWMFPDSPFRRLSKKPAVHTAQDAETDALPSPIEKCKPLRSGASWALALACWADNSLIPPVAGTAMNRPVAINAAAWLLRFFANMAGLRVSGF